MPSEGHIVTVKLTICEFEDGHKVNTCDLFTDGNQDYIDLCGRVIRALRPPHSGSSDDTPDSAPQRQ